MAPKTKYQIDLLGQYLDNSLDVNLTFKQKKKIFLNK